MQRKNSVYRKMIQNNEKFQPYANIVIVTYLV